MGRTAQNLKTGGKKQKRARSDRAGTCIQPYRVEHIIRKSLPNGMRLKRGVAEFLAGAFDHFVGSVLQAAKEAAGGDHKQIDAVHIANVLVDSSQKFHGIAPPVANIHALDPVFRKQVADYKEQRGTLGDEVALEDESE